MPCCHDYIYKAVCRNCGEDAIEALEDKIAKLDQAARAAIGYLVLGARADAEKALRDATACDRSETAVESESGGKSE